jgi:ribbon-helix-helix CopG family protein
VKKTSLYLDPDLDEALARRAADEGLTKAEFIRRTLAAAMQKPRRPKPHGIGIIKGGPPDLSENIERYLGEMGFGED